MIGGILELRTYPDARAIYALKRLNVDQDQFRRYAEQKMSSMPTTLENDHVPVLSLGLRSALTWAEQFARRTGCAALGSDHLLLALVWHGGDRFLKDHGIFYDQVASAISSLGRSSEKVSGETWREMADVVPMSPGVATGWQVATTLASDAGTPVTSREVLLALLSDRDSIAHEFLASYGISFREARQRMAKSELSGTSDDEKYGPLDYRIQEFDQQVQVGSEEFSYLVQRIPALLPPGAPFAFKRTEVGGIIFGGRGVDLEDVVERARSDRE